MAVVRSLRDGRRRQVAVRILVLHEDEGLWRDPATYPDLPRLRAERPNKSRVPLAKHRRRPALLASLSETNQPQLASSMNVTFSVLRLSAAE